MTSHLHKAQNVRVSHNLLYDRSLKIAPRRVMTVKVKVTNLSSLLEHRICRSFIPSTNTVPLTVSNSTVDSRIDGRTDRRTEETFDTFVAPKAQ